MENKKQVIQDFLSQGKSVLCIDSKVDGVKLPKHLMDKEQVNLALSLKFPNPIHFNEEGIETKLKFAGRQQQVFLPYNSIFGISIANDITNNFVWQEDTPPTVLEDAEELFYHLQDIFEDILKKEKEKSKYLDFEEELKKLKKS
jgi:hypothetical protein